MNKISPNRSPRDAHLGGRESISRSACASDLHAFSFLTGRWLVHHRKLKQRLAHSTTWLEFDGTCSAWELLDGAANIDDNLLNDPTGAYRAATLRRLDTATGLWSIWWADGRSSGLEAPVTGWFYQGVGLFEGADVLNDIPIQVRFKWSDITAVSARWEQAFSADGGASWETNWVMKFERA